MKEKILLFFISFFSIIASAQSPHKSLRQGDRNYYRQSYEKAEENYRKALQKEDKSIKGQYNLGNSIYSQDRFYEAAFHYEAASKLANTKEEKALSFYNLGNAFLSQQAATADPNERYDLIQKGIEAYKESLRANPLDVEAKYNLAYAQNLLKELKKQQDSNGQQPPPNSNQNQENPPKNDPQPPSQPNPQQEGMTQEQAKRLIKSMEEEERKVQEKINAKQPSSPASNKNW